MTRHTWKMGLIGGVVLLAAGCGQGGGDSGEDRGALDLPRGIGKADSAFSCKGFCGGKAPAGCYCDETCSDFGDCCPDKAMECDGGGGGAITCGGPTGEVCPPGAKCLEPTPGQGGTCVPMSYCDTEADCAGYPGPVPMCLGTWSCLDHQCVFKCDFSSGGKCYADADCLGGEFCRFDDGMCLLPTFAMLEGTCTTTSPACQPSPEPAPVCGCDGNTYPTACAAQQGGVSIAYEGSCGPTPPPPPPCEKLEEAACAQRSDCDWEWVDGFPGPIGRCVLSTESDKCGPFPGGGWATGEVCNILSCGLGASGVCVKAMDCTVVPFAPGSEVCGCDGQTYENDCVRLLAGVALDHTGPCGSVGGCISSLECGPGQYCAKADGACLGSSVSQPAAKGECKAMPQVCPEIYHAVCGCDGKTYGSPCKAAAAGVNVAQDGECGPKPQPHCAGFCGGQSPSGCWCDSGCAKYGDCCPDLAQACPNL